MTQTCQNLKAREAAFQVANVRTELHLLDSSSITVIWAKPMYPDRHSGSPNKDLEQVCGSQTITMALALTFES